MSSTDSSFPNDEQPVVAGRAPVKVQLEAGVRYAFCTCGRSAIQPFCDGTHRGSCFKPHKFTAERSEEVWLCMCKHTKGVPRCDGTHKTLNGDQGLRAQD